MPAQPPCPEIKLTLVAVYLCELCLDGAGGECHTPGCALFLNRAPDIPIRPPQFGTQLSDAT